MRLLYRYNKYGLSLETGEKYYCVPSDNLAYINGGLRYISDLTDISDETAGIYDPSYSYTGLLYDDLTNGDSFYRFMQLGGIYQSVWGTYGTSTPGTSVTIIDRVYSTTSKTIYLFIIADNYFNVYLNDTEIITTLPNPASLPSTDDSTMFFHVHIFPITINAGYNDFKFVAYQGQSASSNALGVLLLENTISEILGTSTPPFTYLAESSWDILYTSNSAITEGIYFNYGTTTIAIGNYLGITPITDAPPSEVVSWEVDWGDGSATETGSSIIDLVYQYSSTGTYTVTYTLYLTSGSPKEYSVEITVTS
jgi:hypothetical protein